MTRLKNRRLSIIALVFVAGCFFICSCTVFILKAGGFLRNPKLETQESVLSYCEKNKDPYDVLWMPQNAKGFDTLMKRYPHNTTVTILDRNLDVIQNAQGEDCHKALISFLRDTTSKVHVKRKSDAWQLFQEYCAQVDVKNEKTDYAYTVVYTWAIYTPKFTRRLFESLRSIKDSSVYSFRFISLNRDFQKELHKEVPKLKN